MEAEEGDRQCGPTDPRPQLLPSRQRLGRLQLAADHGQPMRSLDLDFDSPPTGFRKLETGRPGSGSSKWAARKSLLVAASVVAGYSRATLPGLVMRTVTFTVARGSPVEASWTSTLRSTGPARKGVGAENTEIR